MKQPSITIVYILPICIFGNFQDHARRFLTSLLLFTEELDWNLIIVSNGGEPSPWALELFDLSNMTWLIRSNDGHDIGGYIDACEQINSDLAFFFGTTAFVTKSGWLSRIVEAWNKYGPGMYGTLSSFEVRAHLNTTGFGCPPSLLRDYPHKVVTRSARYETEHGTESFYAIATRKGMPVKLVTWDGEYDLPAWRSPKNIYRRGDQSNCLTFWHLCESYDQASAITKSAMSNHADGKGNVSRFVQNATHLQVM